MRAPTRVCAITGSRAEFGLLRWVLEEIEERPALSMQLIVTGSHLEQTFGNTQNEIIDAGFRIDRRVHLFLESQTSLGVAKSHGLAVSGIAEALKDLSPDIVLLLGDRFEIHAAAVASLISRIPIAHIHGGEVTLGSIDDQFRHSITKMASLHFVSHQQHLRRVIQMGENPDSVFLVGGLGFESAQRFTPLSRLEVAERLDLKLQEHNFLIVFHPETSSHDFGLAALEALCRSLSSLQQTSFVVSLPNADVGATQLRQCLINFATSVPSAVLVESMGQQLYLSCLIQMDGIVGNSSSGLLEAPALGVPSLDIGSRQEGRLRLPSVLHCEADPAALKSGIECLLSDSHRALVKKTKEELSSVNTSKLICDVLEDEALHFGLPKRFLDLNPADGFYGN